jgi:hypothetical protein
MGSRASAEKVALVSGMFTLTCVTHVNTLRVMHNSLISCNCADGAHVAGVGSRVASICAHALSAGDWLAAMHLISNGCCACVDQLWYQHFSCVVSFGVIDHALAYV